MVTLGLDKCKWAGTAPFSFLSFLSSHPWTNHNIVMMPAVAESIRIPISYMLDIFTTVVSVHVHAALYRFSLTAPLQASRDQLYGACLQQDRNHLHHSKNDKRAVFLQDDSALSTSLQCLVGRTEEDITGSFNFLPTSHGHKGRRK